MILAGVAISLATGEDSIFSKANEAASKWNESAINEQETVNMLLNVLEGGTIPEQKEKVNPPEIKEGMIPVYYDNGWKKQIQVKITGIITTKVKNNGQM